MLLYPNPDIERRIIVQAIAMYGGSKKMQNLLVMLYLLDLFFDDLYQNQWLKAHVKIFDICYSRISLTKEKPWKTYQCGHAQNAKIINMKSTNFVPLVAY